MKSLCVGLLVMFSYGMYGQAYDAELVNQETTIEITNRTLSKTFYYEIRINNRSGEKYAKITIPYSRLERVSNIEGYITDAQGVKVNSLNKNEIIERSSISDYSLYEDDYIKEFTLKHNTYPYTIVYSYQSQQSEFLYVDYWSPVLGSKIPTHSASLEVRIPADYAMAYKSRHVDAPSLRSIGDQVLYSWKTMYATPVESEILSPPLINFLPSVVLVPVQFRFELPGSFATWTSYGNWQVELMQGLQELPESEKSRILQRTRDIADEKEMIRALYHDLQDETRYVNISIETGGMKPFPAVDVAVNKYGDCEALTNYFKSQLDYLGIPSYYTKVRAGRPIQSIDTTFPSQQFNHVILFVPLKHDTLWLDCTSDGPFNYPGTFIQNRQAFITEAGKSRFSETPALRPDDVLESRYFTMAAPDGAGSSVSVRATYRGKMFEWLLDLEQSHSTSDKFNAIRDNIIEQGQELKNYTFKRKGRDSLYIQLFYGTLARNIYSFYGNDLLIRNIPFSLPALEKPIDRKLPVQIDYPIYRADTISYAIPAGYTLQQTGSDLLMTSPYGEYSMTFAEKEGTIIVVKKLVILAGQIPLSDYEAFYTFIKGIDAAERKTYITLIK